MILLQKVYRFLSFRDRSEKEIRNYLKLKTENPEQVINQLKEQGLIDDERFAKEWVQSRRRKYGLQRIKQELAQKGIDKEIIASIMYQVLSIKGEDETATETLNKKVRAWENLDEINFRKKALGFLVRKGFEYEVAKVVVDNFLKNR